MKLMGDHIKMSKHKIISFIKSFIRLLGCVAGMAATANPVLFAAFLALAVAEVFGIVEEVGEK